MRPSACPREQYHVVVDLTAGHRARGRAVALGQNDQWPSRASVASGPRLAEALGALARVGLASLFHVPKFIFPNKLLPNSKFHIK